MKTFNVNVHVDYNFSCDFSEAEIGRAERLYDAGLEPAGEGECERRRWAALSDFEKAEHLAYDWMSKNEFLSDAIADVEAAGWEVEAAQ